MTVKSLKHIRKLLLVLGLLVLLAACNSTRHVLLDNETFKLEKISGDETYGYTEENPIKVGGIKDSEGPLNERRFLNALAGPQGERVLYNRRGSCCHFETSNGFMGGGLLDIYEVTWGRQTDTLLIYINMYDKGTLEAPKGFTIRQPDYGIRTTSDL